MRHLSLFLSITLTVLSVNVGEAAKKITLEALFEEGALDLEEPSNFMWLPDGESVVYRLADGDDINLWREDMKSGARHKVVSWSAMEEDLCAKRPGWEAEVMSDPNVASGSRLASALSPDGSGLVASVAGDLFFLDLVSGQARFLTGDSEVEFFPTFSADGSRLAFTRGGDLFWLELSTGVVHRLTDRGENTDLLNGIADWVYEEEMGTERSFWWSPDGRSLAFIQYDVAPVRVASLLDSSGLYPKVERQRYPKAGTPNPKVRLGVVEVGSGEITWLKIGQEDFYIARVGWTPDGEVWLQRLNRDQTELDLMVV
ncbi:MAG: DPP IV N-terminal domain-containing protein, partial [Thermoanaerobaculales bacterium]|nr:DPP IV N-terminal domain-containing protein [Thermoanaerobaculales bacterium]